GGHGPGTAAQVAHGEPVLLDGVDDRCASDEGDVRGGGEPAAEVAADASGAHDRDPGALHVTPLSTSRVPALLILGEVEAESRPRPPLRRGAVTATPRAPRRCRRSRCAASGPHPRRRRWEGDGRATSAWPRRCCRAGTSAPG